MIEITRTYYALKDIAINISVVDPNDAIPDVDEILQPDNLYDFVRGFNWWQLIAFYSILKGQFGKIIPNYSDIPACLRDETEANSVHVLLHDYLVAKIWNSTIAVSESDSLEDNEDVSDFVQRAGAWLCATYPAYDARLKAFEALKAKLTDRVGDVTTQKFNDAPQSPYIAGTTDGDDHLTNITATTNENDLMTPSARMAEIDNDIKNIYLEWVDAFVNTFIIE